MTAAKKLSYLLLENNADYLVINKAPGVNLHRNHHDESLLDILHRDFPGESLHLVHRLDDATSGLLLIAKNVSAAAEFGRLFASREVEKFYFALAEGKPSKKQGMIVGDIKKSRSGSYLLSRTRSNPSISQFFSYALVDGLRGYLLRPHTGKTHQLRVVMKSLGVPILGDTRYGPRKQQCDRMYLHAMALRFQFNGCEQLYVCLPSQGDAFLNEDLQAILESCNPPWHCKWPSIH
ncbi:Ribosomal large subunit pseudouridine synthase A [Zhongshania aliphaticivorans]|uniref:Ribosomal large subunit pseudouridine synthase A n=1 Tax=Zhongshania aliphaticivorans TaxID=1470434 RepID=A0A5S9P0J5_9GAMM|nr:TIGR01621 family pseudouridine synthase [Zhongshania aliphaticivorans]CAA0089768.1 Ribosomal large subunit pseudouridine synthase A [Zhongshania aliphaticivorans]CAA0096745.1 Ribosomal large subunit pseudouridine synthase A [Zhongshania aliphaticivorans]